MSEENTTATKEEEILQELINKKEVLDNGTKRFNNTKPVIAKTYTPQSLEAKEVPERDKPFYLAIISAVLFGVGAIFAMYNRDMDFFLQWVSVTGPFMGMSWGFYFKGTVA